MIHDHHFVALAIRRASSDCAGRTGIRKFTHSGQNLGPAIRVVYVVSLVLSVSSARELVNVLIERNEL